MAIHDYESPPLSAVLSAEAQTFLDSRPELGRDFIDTIDIVRREFPAEILEADLDCDPGDGGHFLTLAVVTSESAEAVWPRLDRTIEAWSASPCFAAPEIAAIVRHE